MVTMEKIDIKHVLNAIDNRDFSWIDTLTQEEKKKLSIWQIMRFVSSCDAYNNDIKFHYLQMTNDIGRLITVFCATNNSSLSLNSSRRKNQK